MRAKKLKKQTKSSLDKQCLDLWSKCVRTRQRACRICGSTYRLQAHHIRSKSNASTRYNLRNGLCLCSKCHVLQKFNPERFQDMILSVIGDEEYQALKSISLGEYKWILEELKELKTELKVILKDLEDEYGVLAP